MRYHSALRPPADVPDRLARHTGRNGLTFVADVSVGVPPEFDDCDVLYADLPWASGYGEFARRAGAEPAPYAALLETLRAYCAHRTAPVVLVTGATAARVLRPDATSPVRLPVGDAVACLWRLQPWVTRVSSREVLARLAADRYAVVGDPFCGYGNTGAAFAAAGKRYVMSDLNPSCVAYVARQPWA